MSTNDTPAVSALEQEIAEQPDAVRRVLTTQRARLQRIADAWGARDDVNGVLLAARGTSDNAARYAQYVLGAHNRLQVALATPSLFTRYQAPPRLDGLVVGAISQSGRSPDVVDVVGEANRQGRPTFALTNDVDSPLAREADEVVDLSAGPERSVAATKTYTTSLAAIAALSVALDGDAARAAQLDAVADHVADSVELALHHVEVPDWLLEARACAVVGRGYNYATAFEIALKVKELTGIAAEPYSSADLLHGPIAAVRVGVPAIVVAPSGVVQGDVLEVAARLREQDVRLVVVSDDPAALALADLPLPLPTGVEEWLSPIPAVIAGQVLGWRIAAARGLDVDRPAGLQKVTETH